MAEARSNTLAGVLEGESIAQATFNDENDRTLRTFFDRFRTRLRRNELVADLLPEIHDYRYHRNISFYSDLSISERNGIAIYIKLKLPYQPHEYHINPYARDACYVDYCLTNNCPLDSHRAEATFFEDRYIKPDKVKNWFMTYFQQILQNYNRSFPLEKVIQLQNNSPFITVQINKPAGGNVIVSLVPVIAVDSRTLNYPVDTAVAALTPGSPQAFLLPIQPGLRTGMNDPLTQERVAQANRSWRVNMEEAEDMILRNRDCAPSVIKLLKVLKYRQGWQDLDIYYLKTVVMSMVLAEPDGWDDDMLETRFIKALQDLRESLETRNLPYLFSMASNLLETVASEALFSGPRTQASVIIRQLNEFTRKETDIYTIF